MGQECKERTLKERRMSERGHRAQIPVPSGAHDAEGGARLPKGSVGLARLRTGHLRGLSQRCRAGDPPRVGDQALLGVPKLGKSAQLAS